MFYSMIQSTNSHVRRLLNDKTLYEEELQRAKDEAKIKMQTLLIQCKSLILLSTTGISTKLFLILFITELPDVTILLLESDTKILSLTNDGPKNYPGTQ